MNTLEKGFYYHYKHDDSKGIFDYAYEVMGVGFHTEIAHDSDSPDRLFAVYRPLYESAFVYKNGKSFDVRPLDMFLEEVTKDGKTFPRFTEITDQKIISELENKRAEMYSQGA